MPRAFRLRELCRVHTVQDLKDFKLSSASGGSPVSGPLASAAICSFWTGLNHNCRMDVDGGCVCVCVRWWRGWWCCWWWKLGWLYVCVCGWKAVATLTRSRIICGYGFFPDKYLQYIILTPTSLNAALKRVGFLRSNFLMWSWDIYGTGPVVPLNILHYILMKHSEPESCCLFNTHQTFKKS